MCVVSEMWAKLFIPVILLLLLCLASANVLFFPRASLYMTYDAWRLNLPIETRTTWKLATKLEYRINAFKNSFAENFVKYHEEIRTDLAVRLERKFMVDSELLDHELNLTLDSLKHLEKSASSRRKRSLIPFVGDALSSLFGTATETQLQDILSRINDVSETQDGMLNVVDSTVTVLNQTLVNVQMNRKTINKLTDVVNSLTDRLDLLKNGLTNGYFADSLESDMDVVFTQLISALKEFRKDVLGMETVLSFTENGILPRSLLPPSRFTKILDDIQKSLPPELSLPFNVTDTDSYYANVHTLTVRRPGEISVILTIPLLSVSDQYNVFQIFNVPVPKVFGDQGYLANYKVENAKFIAMSEDQLKFMLIDDHDLHLYLSKKLPFAPIRQPVYNTMTSSLCLPALLTNDIDKIDRFCEKVLSLNATSDPTASYIGNGLWIVLSPRPADIEVRCKTGQTTKHSHMIKTMKPLTLVELNVGCGGFNTHFQLPIHFQAETHLEPYQISQLNRTLHVTDVWNHFSSVLTEHNVSVHHAIHTLSPVKVTLSAIKAHLHTLRSQAQYHRQTVLISAMSVTSVALCGLFVCVMCKCVSRISGFCPSVLTDRPVPLNVPTPGCSVPLQDWAHAATLRDPTSADPARPDATDRPDRDRDRPSSTRALDDTVPINCSTH